MKQTRLNRPTSRAERALPWLLFGALALAGVCLVSLAIFAGIHALPESRETLFTLVAGLGVVAALLVGFTFFYSLRKRGLQEQVPGSMMAWLKSHVYIGLLSLGVVFVHVWASSFSPVWWSTGKIALLALALLVVSGVAWRIIYVVIPPVVANSVGNLSTADTQDKARMARVEIDKVLAGKSVEFRQAAHSRLNGKSLAEVKSGLTLSAAEQPDWERFVRLSDRLERYARREIRQKVYARFLQDWKNLHLPLAVVLAVLIGVHLWDTLHLPSVLAGGEVSQLPPSAACANCHPGIVNDWRLAMHSQAQTGPIIVAQTNLALERYPAFGRACNNCHAPIGTALTNTPTLPLDVQNTLRSTANGAVLDDGVTCVVCHTLAQAPEERRGMFDKFPVVKGDPNQFANMFGPSLGEPPALPNPRHNAGVGFMTDNVAASQLCGACHNVKVDVDGDGQVTAFPGSEGNNKDTDGDGQLDENELEFAPNGKALKDLVLQTTFDEWQDYVASQRSKGQGALGCVDCHMPAQAAEPLVSSASGNFFGGAPVRANHSHAFLGVDYNLSPGYYEQAGMAPDARELVLKDRAAFLRSAASLAISPAKPANGKLSVLVSVESNLVGHSLPTGFAFARQMWLEVSARTATGKQVCLADVTVKGKTIKAQCASGQVDSSQAELTTCDPLALADLGLKSSKNDERVQLDPASVAPLDRCDPWLANFQKILTDGDPDGDGVFREVPYQSLRADIVKTRVRVSDQQAMDALNPTLIVNGQPRNAASFEYIFDLSGLQGQDVIVTATLHFRHLPPYFIRALDGKYPDGLTAADLLQNLTVVDMATASLDAVHVP
jgi:hypothetical protein